MTCNNRSKKAASSPKPQMRALYAMNNQSKLLYFGTDIEVLEGDYIIFKTFFTRRPRNGRVSYIPKMTGRELAKSNKNPDDWLIELEDSTVTGWLYSPEDLQPPKRLSFVKRKDDDYKGMTSQELEEYEQNA